MDDIEEDSVGDADSNGIESSASTSDESDGEDTSITGSLTVIDDESEFDSESEIIDGISPTIAPLLSDITIDLYQLLCSVNDLLGRVRAIVKLIRKSSLIDAYVREKMSSIDGAKELVCDFRVRWNSTCLMLERLLTHKDIINSIVSSPDRIAGLHRDQKAKLKSLALSHNDWDVIAVLHEILRPFAIATKILSAQNYPTMAASLYVTRKLEMFLSDNDGDSSIVTVLKQSLRFRFKLYFQTKIPHRQKDFLLVSFMSTNLTVPSRNRPMNVIQFRHVS